MTHQRSESGGPGTRRLAVTALLLAGFSTTCVSAEETYRFDWLMSGRVAGFHVITVQDDGTRVVDFEYKDRGRGPRTHEVTRFLPDGRVASLDISGQAYMGANVAETFHNDGTTARWHSELEQGSASSDQGGFYLAANGTSEQLAQLARALLQTADGTLPLLPSGRAEIARVNQARLGPAGDERDVTLYAISGLDLTPTYLWLDEGQELFAQSIYWMGMVPEGWAEYLPELQEKQQASETQYYEELARQLTWTLPVSYAIGNVHVVDVVSGQLQRDRVVLVQDGLIAAVTGRLPDDFDGKVVDGGGGYLIPGLWDMHTHIGVEQGMQHVAGGVTTTRDVGNNPEDQQHARAQFEAGQIIGPHVIPAGFIDRQSPYSAPIGKLVTSREEALQMVRDYAAMGYPQIKLYSSIEPGWVKAITREAHDLGMRVSGHVPNGMTARNAIKDGYDEIQHINMLFLNFLADRSVDTRTAARITLVGERGGELDLDSRKVRRLLKLMHERGTVIDPTVALFHGMLQHRSGELNPSYAMVADHMPPTVLRSLRSAIMEINEDNEAQYAAGAEAMVQMVGKLYAAGVKIVAGTDATPGFLYHRELELYHQAGIPNAAILRLATLGAAEVMGMDAKSGSITPGKAADMVLLRDNPLQDISAVRNARRVFIGRRAYAPARLYQAMGIKPFTEP